MPSQCVYRCNLNNLAADNVAALRPKCRQVSTMLKFIIAFTDTPLGVGLAMFAPDQRRIAVVIPCYRVELHLPDVLRQIGTEVEKIVCVIDGCPGKSEQVARTAAEHDSRIEVIALTKNLGVGGAFIQGLHAALDGGADIVIKLDGDGQMSPAHIAELVQPLLAGEADYAKGNRFFELSHLQSMPWIRLLGNAGLSFLSKLSSGYWNIMDPTNGFLAITAPVARQIPWSKLNRRYFFESDLLFRLSIVRAVVVDVPMPARYNDETSHLSVINSLLKFPWLYKLNFLKRLFYCYFLREFHVASMNLILGILLVTFGITFGGLHWFWGYQLNQLASAGTVMFAALPIILGWQALLSFLSFDVANVPKKPLTPAIWTRRSPA